MKIYEIILKENISILDYFKDIKSIGEFAINGNTFYLHTDIGEPEIKQKFSKTFSVKEINLQNCNFINSLFCKEFCLDFLTKDQIKKFEQDNQKPLETINKKLDYLLELKESGRLNDYVKNLINKPNEKVGDNIAEGKTKESPNNNES